MKNSKTTHWLLTLVLFLSAPLARALNIAHRTGITSVNTTRVRFVNNTKRDFVIKNIVCKQKKVKGGVVGYQLGDEKTKNFSEKTIKPGKTDSIFLVDRDLPVGAFYGTIQDKPTPYEVWAMDVVDKNDPNCNFAIFVEAGRGEMPPSGIALAFKAAKAMFSDIAETDVSIMTDYHDPLWQQALDKVAGTAFVKGTMGALAIAATEAILSSTVLIDTVAQGVGQLLGYIAVDIPEKEKIQCVNVSYKYKWEGGLYKNLYITIDNPQ